MEPIYLGVDVGGADNTWVAALAHGNDSLAVVHGPSKESLEAIVSYCETNNVVATAIDAQLTASLSEGNGMRASDMELRDMLAQEGGSRNWVAASASLLAVPVQGRLLAEHLSPSVATLLETHPRASLLFGLGREFLAPLQEYRRDDEVGREYVRILWQSWSAKHCIATCSRAVRNDGALDSLVCATVAYQLHHEPAKLYKLRHEVAGKTGRGPFYVLAPETAAEA